MADTGKSKTRRKNISPRPPNADGVTEAFRDARRSTETDLAALQKIIGVLDQEWEGNVKARFLETSRNTSDRILNALLPQLQALEKKYREYAGNTASVGG